MELTDHYAVRRGWNAARSKEFTVVSPAYTVTPGVLLKRMVPTVGPQSPMPRAPSSPTPLAHPPTPGAVPPRHRSTHRSPWPAREEAAFALLAHTLGDAALQVVTKSLRCVERVRRHMNQRPGHAHTHCSRVIPHIPRCYQ